MGSPGMISARPLPGPTSRRQRLVTALDSDHAVILILRDHQSQLPTGEAAVTAPSRASPSLTNMP